MLLNDRKNRPWIIVTAALAVAAIGWYAFECRAAGRLLGGGSRPGLAFGVAGGLICVFEMLLWPRKVLRKYGQTFRLGWTQTWMRAHIWLGLLSLPLLVMHGGVFPWGGRLSTVLMVLFLGVIASGIWGLVMQQILPRRMLAEVPAETIYAQIDYVRAQLRGEAARLVVAACGPAAGDLLLGSEFRVPGKTRPVAPEAIPEPIADPGPLLNLYHTEVAPYLCPEPLYDYYRDGGRDAPPPNAEGTRRPALREPGRAALIFNEAKLRLDAQAHPIVDALAGLCDQRRQFETQARLHVWLHNWLAVHLPLSVAMTVLMLVHAVLALKYL